ncbi:MAG: iron uptake porin [Calothrix sp. CSU_2_0]|nr:iron uptake porin [Calothrix sp. CSU_2_0]
MTKLFWNVLKLSPLVVAATFFAANTAFAVEAKEGVTSVAQLTQESNSIGQVTSVSQFSDVQPTDWAFQSLQSLVERYGCIAGYPGGTYRGNRALTRYEFAAGLNACLDRVNELIATASADLVTKEDLATLQRLQEEFTAELETLRGRVDQIEARTAELEGKQFSTTTKLKGEAIFVLSDLFGGENKKVDENTNATFSNRVRLTLESSFSGTDKLQLRLNSGNIVSNAPSSGTNMTRLGIDGTTAASAVVIDKANYSFNLGEKLAVKVDATGAELNDNVTNFSPDFQSSGTGAISRYGRFSPIYRAGSGGAGVTATFNPTGKVSLTGAYLSNDNSNPGVNQGVFNGDNAIFGQLGFKPNDKFNVGLTYARTYTDSIGGFDSFASGTGSSKANNPFGTTVASTADNYGVQASFKLSNKATLGGWYGFTKAERVNGTADADISYWAATLGIKDFAREGNTLGLIFGQPPKLTGGSGATVAKDVDTSYHLEALYKMQLNDRIQVTPSLLVIFNPEHNASNDTIYVGTLRTTFSF